MGRTRTRAFKGRLFDLLTSKGIDPSTIVNRWKHQETPLRHLMGERFPDLASARIYCEVLGMSLDQFFSAISDDHRQASNS